MRSGAVPIGRRSGGKRTSSAAGGERAAGRDERREMEGRGGLVGMGGETEGEAVAREPPHSLNSLALSSASLPKVEYSTKNPDEEKISRSREIRVEQGERI
eukprot:scaffold144580_cov32-Tisochrysis_lutea.AAC.1